MKPERLALFGLLGLGLYLILQRGGLGGLLTGAAASGTTAGLYPAQPVSTVLMWGTPWPVGPSGAPLVTYYDPATGMPITREQPVTGPQWMPTPGYGGGGYGRW